MKFASITVIVSLLTLLLIVFQNQDPIEEHYAGHGKYFGPDRPTHQQGLVDDQPQVFQSKFLTSELIVPVGVYDPTESELEFLPFLEENTNLIEGKRVLEVGTGSGIVSLYAAERGAQSVVATDISEQAVVGLRNNALSLSLPQVEAKLVPEDNPGPYSVLKTGQKFDLILSNPPWVINLDKAKNSAVEDTELLVFSLIDGLQERLASDGVVILFCNTYYSHQTIVKYARSKGLQAKSHPPNRILPWEAEALMNSYSRRLEDRSGSAPGTLQFRWQNNREIATLKLETKNAPPLFEKNSGNQYHGLIVLQNQGS